MQHVVGEPGRRHLTNSHVEASKDVEKVSENPCQDTMNFFPNYECIRPGAYIRYSRAITIGSWKLTIFRLVGRGEMDGVKYNRAVRRTRT